MKFVKNPRAIYEESMDIISQYTAGLNLEPVEEQVYRRIIHTTGDPGIARYISMSPDFVTAAFGVMAKDSFIIYTDVNMIKAGINEQRVAELGGRVVCRIAEPEIIAEARRTGETRAMTAVTQSKDLIAGNMVVIGNAPTALFAVLRLVSQGIRPGVIVGTPVGFVGARESKEELEKAGIPYITIRGTRGGSTVAAAVVNALLYNYGSREETG
ncbi:MAG: precorrin-8X methylmutase [Thermoanaerobacteraceae bacterium]|nr:precorrin-8X methylmutase [Thermoanaerobacteraceae bacterium]